MISEEQKKKLVAEAIAAMKNPYPKDSPSVYAAAVLTDQGNIYSAANYWSDTASLSLHGEQLALAHAAAHGEGTILAMAATSNKTLDSGEFTAPCHMCKQLLWESRLRSDTPLLLILVNAHEETKEFDIDELMPLPWPAQKK